MQCSICNGAVLWMGKLTDLTHTKCQNCGATNSQRLNNYLDEDDDEKPEEDEDMLLDHQSGHVAFAGGHCQYCDEDRLLEITGE